MKIKVSTQFAKIAPRKVRLISDVVKGMLMNTALTKLQYTQKSASIYLINLVKQARVIAEEKNPDSLWKVRSITVNEGPKYTRRRFGSRGRSSIYRRKSSHITLCISNIEKEKKDNGTKN